MAKNAKSKADLWRGRVEQWKRSGLSQAKFCERNGITKGTFGWWKCRLDRSARAKRTRKARTAFKKAPSFVPVRLVPATTSPTPTLELVLVGGQVLRIRPGFDAALLRQVVAALESPRC